MWSGATVSVVFPVYNEEEGLAAAIEDFFSVPYVDEIVVVDNNSTDRSAEIAQGTAARVVRESNQGYGHALQRGLREATGDYIVLVEPDGTFMAKDITRLLAYADDCDMVMGTRTTRELIRDGANMGWFLKWGNWAVAKGQQLLFNGPSITDCGCTFRLIRREALAKIQAHFSVGSSHFLPHMVCLALLNGLKIVEVPVNYRRRLGTSKITGRLRGTLRVGFRMIGVILAHRLQLKRGFARRSATGPDAVAPWSSPLLRPAGG